MGMGPARSPWDGDGTHQVPERWGWAGACQVPAGGRVSPAALPGGGHPCPLHLVAPAVASSISLARPTSLFTHGRAVGGLAGPTGWGRGSPGSLCAVKPHLCRAEGDPACHSCYRKGCGLRTTTRDARWADVPALAGRSAGVSAGGAGWVCWVNAFRQAHSALCKPPGGCPGRLASRDIASASHKSYGQKEHWKPLSGVFSLQDNSA